MEEDDEQKSVFCMHDFRSGIDFNSRAFFAKKNIFVIANDRKALNLLFGVFLFCPGFQEVK